MEDTLVPREERREPSEAAEGFRCGLPLHEIRARENDLIARIYSLPIKDLLLGCCEGVREIIPFDHSFTGFNDQSNRIGTTFNYQSNDTSEELLQLYAQHYQYIDFLSWCYNQCWPLTFRATDLVSLDVIEGSRIHKEWQSRLGITYDLTACVAANDILYGTMSLMRSKEHGDFTDEEVALLDEINKHLCNRFALAFPNGVNRAMMDVSADPIASAFALTPREWEITCLLMQGLSRAEIADELHISKNTLKRHVANIYRKMDVSNMRQFYAVLSQVDTTLENEQLAEMRQAREESRSQLSRSRNRSAMFT